MTFPAAMRLGSLEVVAAVALFAVFALRRPASGAKNLPEQASLVPAVVELEITERGRSRRVELSTPVTIGRSTEADVLLMDPEVSRRHVRIEEDGGAVFVTDLRSSNGTFLNGRRIGESIELRAGDEIDAGAARIVFVGSKTWK